MEITNNERGEPTTVGAMTLAEFCKRYHISRPGLFKLRRAGRGPDVLQLGRRKVLITYEAAREWEQRMTTRAAEVDAA